jgi:hypothetical protein
MMEMPINGTMRWCRCGRPIGPDHAGCNRKPRTKPKRAAKAKKTVAPKTRKRPVVGQITKAAVSTNTNLLDVINNLVCYIERVGGFMEHEDQIKLRAAQAVLIEHGRR